MKIINGRQIAKHIKSDIKTKIKNFKDITGKTPGLATILVGSNVASKIYIQSKIKACQEVGIQSFHNNISTQSSQDAIIRLINDLNSNTLINGILLQLPLPDKTFTQNCINAINPVKDVDGLHPVNYGKLSLLKSWNDIIKENVLIPCTPLGIMHLLQYSNIQLSGKTVLIIGRSNLVGKPLAILMLSQNATVITAHSKTYNLDKLTKIADVIIVAVGIPNFLNKNYNIKDNTVIIDVGINRTVDGLCGDVDFNYIQNKNVRITPVPGGVGPMTITMLLSNTLKAFINQNKINL
ncbi:MAG: bifunctional 5,10-methylenetetrahydrofolate dehydrogenase/5,10-methenyltetrahydrofolate cyclohydrolase [Endomicrobium sp.]|jgi:methylenetetrahydrofolate dehydrogenase (NADP+)/methenyltetrahydrofolate cyclohydrolase|nr:bifunctional 5,10-methylenetetrahydrofolate dehydrogenase/5,10-methenyltetrahydrofolate cyclohydrolase [Endomicrobium sp.]